jgi:hypothetical protein
MAINLSDLEAKVMDVVHGVMHEAAAAEPAIWDALAAELTAVGVPPSVSDALRVTVAGLISDYQARKTAAETAAAAPPSEAVPVA